MTTSQDIDVTESEKNAMETLRKKISGEINKKMYNETHLIYRFLKARDWNVGEAEKMFRKWLIWRKENRMDVLLEEYKEPEFLQMHFKNMSIGRDKEDSEVIYFSVGNFDVPGFHLSAKRSNIEKSSIKLVETCEQYAEKESKKLKKRVAGFILIIDTKGLSFANATNKNGLQTFIRLVRILQENYPERMKIAYVINAASYFTLSFNIVKNFLAPRLVNKLKIYGTDGWQEDLLKIIEADQLPKFLGGNKTDPDGNPLCKTFVNHFGPIPEKYYIHKSKNPLSESPDIQKLVLTRASFSEIPIEIRVPNSILEWEFDIRNRDVGFGLFYKEAEDELTELVSLKRLETADFTETGVMKCEKAGDYVVVFDNTYSWIRSKEILYRITVVSPEDQDNCFASV